MADLAPDDMARLRVKKVRSVSSYPPSGCIGTSLSVERWFEGGAWHARAVFGDVVGPEVTSDSGEAAWFLAAAEYFEQIDHMPRA